MYLSTTSICLFTVLFTSSVLARGDNHVSGHLTEGQLRELCPKDKSLCFKKVAEGQCFGNSLKASVLQKQCKCSCDAVHHARIQKCCLTVGEEEMKFCMPLCRYNTTSEELGSTLGLKCISQLTTWSYCAADATDQSDCCQQRGIPSECQSFCKGDVPTCDTQSILNYEPCIQHMSSIIACQRQGLTAQPRYDPDWSSTCEWEGK